MTGRHTKEVDERPETRAARLEPQIQLVHVPPKPPAPDTRAIVTALGDDLPGGATNEQRREVYAGIDRQLQ